MDSVSGETFNVIVNHLNRGSAAKRRSQATNLRTWLEATDEPSIVLGDFNFDLKVPDWIDGRYDGNRAYNILTKAPSPVLWVEHTPQLTTQCSDDFDSVLDFVFLAGMAQQRTTYFRSRQMDVGLQVKQTADCFVFAGRSATVGWVLDVLGRSVGLKPKVFKLVLG